MNNPKTHLIQRMDKEEALYTLNRAPMGVIMGRAHTAKKQWHPDNRVTFVYDTNPNYTNVCTTGCRFCAFHCSGDSPEAYALTPIELARKVQFAWDKGATTVLLQGGHNPEITLNDWLGYIRAIGELCPDIHIHPFSPPEIIFMAQKEGISVREVLSVLKENGISTLPGGGAEVLSDRVRAALSPKKYSSAEWLDVMEQAHELGFRTTATLMFGHIESDEEIVDHLLALRELQDRTSGFNSFIPWSFKPGGSPLSKEIKKAAHPARYVRIIALARLVLDNFSHIQSSWFSESIAAGQLGLLAGADDFGGILVEENVLKQTGYERKMALDTVLDIIRSAGFTPVRRDSQYQIVETYQVRE